MLNKLVEVTYRNGRTCRGYVTEVKKSTVEFIDLETGLEVTDVPHESAKIIEETIKNLSSVSTGAAVYTIRTSLRLTEKEYKILTYIKDRMEIYGDGFSDADPEYVPAYTKMSIESARGVLGSLSKKGLISLVESEGFNVYVMTKKGYDLFDEKPDFYEDLREMEAE
ncbi:hypothetical protein [Bacillus atrophaeus]|uniref:hypothetical protein n=1 Tax=Bacillus atrophaeus TaxID=1452 RepID=UPI00227EDE3B|nr:hypothetical protein [Bacillus atrophaeus]MCY8856489.1 hypothetical protein [Bacillus atrophaeus]